MVLPGLKSLEEIAAEIWKIPIERIATSTHKRMVVEARQVLIVYRVDYLKETWEAATIRYGMDHSSVKHCKKTVYDLKDTNRDFQSKYEEFLEKAKKLRP